jgi:surface polysaccharide O-acyltransferase-like enzyme
MKDNSKNDPPPDMRISSIDSFRVLASFAVVLSHTNWGTLSRAAGDVIWWDLYVVEKQVASVAIPFFAIAAGYFFGRRIREGEHPRHLFLVYAKRILKIVCFWSVVYFVLKPSGNGLMFSSFSGVHSALISVISNPVLVLVNAGKTHLWYMASMLVSLAILAFFVSRGQDLGLLLFALMLYFCSLLFRNYSFLSEEFGLGTQFLKHFVIFFLTIFFAIGWFLSSERLRITQPMAVLFAVIGFVFYATEYHILVTYFHAPINPTVNVASLGTILTATGCFLVLISSKDIGRGTVMPFVGKYTLGIYVSHMVFMDLSAPFRERFHSISFEIACAFIVYALALGFTIICTKNRFLKQVVM